LRAIARARVAHAYRCAADTLAALAGFGALDQAELLATPLTPRREGEGRRPPGRRVRDDTTAAELAAACGIEATEAARILCPGEGERPAGEAPAWYPEREPLDGLRGAERKWRIWTRRAQAMTHCESGDAVWCDADGMLVVDKMGKPVMRGIRCESRLCGRCAVRVASKVRAALEPVLLKEGRPQSFVLATLTRRAHDDETLQQAYDALNEALGKLRNSKTWKRYVRAALVSVEVTWSDEVTRARKARGHEDRARELEGELEWVRSTSDGRLPPMWQGDEAHALNLRAQVERLRSSQGGHWHVHAHAVLLPTAGGVVPRDELLALWARCLDVPVSDATFRPERPRKTIQEVCKYAIKPLDLGQLPHDRLQELIVWLEGRRLVRTWGDWYDREDLTKPLSELDERDPTDEGERVSDERIIGYRIDTRAPVRGATAELRTDDAALEAARMARALAWEERRKARQQKQEQEEPPPTDAEASRRPAPARVVRLGAVPTAGTVEVRGATSAEELRALAVHVEEDRLLRREMRRAASGAFELGGGEA
jgi:hypothetical protein